MRMVLIRLVATCVAVWCAAGTGTHGGSTPRSVERRRAPPSIGAAQPFTVTLAGPRGSTLELPTEASGSTLCGAITRFCGPGREGAECVKRSLRAVLENGEAMAAFRASTTTMSVGPDTLFLCSPVPFDLRAATTSRVSDLSAMLARAVASSATGNRGQGEGDCNTDMAGGCCTYIFPFVCTTGAVFQWRDLLQ